MLLSELKIGMQAKIIMVNGDGALRHRLLEMGLVPNVLITMIKKAPLGDPLEIMVRGYILTLRELEARLIEVEEV